MNKLIYHQALTHFTTLTLLHLYCYMDVSSRFIPIKKRNELLIKFLKKQIALPDNAIIKKDIKIFMVMARKGQHLDAQLWELHKRNCQVSEQITDADHFFSLFNYLYEQHDFKSIVDCPECEREKGIIYINQALAETNFNKERVLVTSFPIFIMMDEPSVLVELINNHDGMFIAEQIPTSIDDRYTTLLLHKK